LSPTHFGIPQAPLPRPNPSPRGLWWRLLEAHPPSDPLFTVQLTRDHVVPQSQRPYDRALAAKRRHWQVWPPASGVAPLPRSAVPVRTRYRSSFVAAEPSLRDPSVRAWLGILFAVAPEPNPKIRLPSHFRHPPPLATTLACLRRGFPLPFGGPRSVVAARLVLAVSSVAAVCDRRSLPLSPLPRHPLSGFHPCLPPPPLAYSHQLITFFRH
jgi:hypothetical protein